jgi:hypothetical protein
VLIAAVLLAAAPERVAAQATEPADGTLVSLGLKGQFLLKSFSYFRDAPNDHRNFYNEGRLQVEWTRTFAPWIDARVLVEARKDDNDYARDFSFQIPETSPHRSVLALKEAVVRMRGGPVDVALGKQIFAWGTGDAYNPTDLVNPYDYLDVLDNEKLGVWSVAARVRLGPASLTTVVVPVFTPSRLPLATRRWTPPPPPGFVGIVDNPVLPEQDIDAMQYAARLRGTVAGWDLSVSYYDGFKNTPVFRESSIAVAPAVVLPRFTPVFTRHRVAGFDWSTTFGKLEFHGEGVFRFVVADGREDVFQGIGGVNYTWEGLGLPWLDAITVVFEYARQAVLAIRDRSIVEAGGAGQVGDLLADNAFRDALVGRIELKLTDDTRLKITEIVDLSTTPSHYTQVKVWHRLADAWSFEAGLDFLSGNAETFWGRWRSNDRFFFALKYLF